MRRRLDKAGYQEVRTPQLVDRKLWEASGHWEKFRESMFLAEVEEESGADKQVAALKPMNCPCHVQIFNQGIKSYRDLPLRLAEFGSCHRYEPSGALHGIMRVRGFVQDDAHIFCREDQITAEGVQFCALLASVYRDLGFEKFRIKFSDRPAKRAGSDAVWDQAEAALMEATRAAGYDVEINPGEGAFYGPKLEFVLTDAIGRDWQCGTFQVDFVLPDRLGATYVGRGRREAPAGHAAPGDPRLVRALHRHPDRGFCRASCRYGSRRCRRWWRRSRRTPTPMRSACWNGCRPPGSGRAADLRNEKINYKVREHSVAKVPVMLVVGRREAEEGTVSLRRLGGKEQETLSLDAALQALAAEALPPDLRPTAP